MMENDGKSDSPPRMMEIPSFVFLFFFCAFPKHNYKERIFFKTVIFTENNILVNTFPISITGVELDTSGN